MGSGQGTLRPSLNPESQLGVWGAGRAAAGFTQGPRSPPHPASLVRRRGVPSPALARSPRPSCPARRGAGVRRQACGSQLLLAGTYGWGGLGSEVTGPCSPPASSLPDAPPQPMAALPHPLASLGTDQPQPPGSPVGVGGGCGGCTHRTPAAPPGRRSARSGSRCGPAAGRSGPAGCQGPGALAPAPARPGCAVGPAPAAASAGQAEGPAGEGVM